MIPNNEGKFTLERKSSFFLTNFVHLDWMTCSKASPPITMKTKMTTMTNLLCAVDEVVQQITSLLLLVQRNRRVEEDVLKNKW
jgi:hypothetical protein